MKIQTRVSILLSLITLLSALTGCGGGGGVSDSDLVNPPEVKTLSGRANWTGFIAGPNASPMASGYTGDRPAISIGYAANRRVIIYMHGSTNSRQLDDCDDYFNRPPTTLTDAISNDDLIFYICSAAKDTDRDGDYIYGRVDEFKGVVNELTAAGIKLSNIYLAGHSAGGWAALMAASKIAGIGGVIAYAPAFAGPKTENGSTPWWQVLRPAQAADMTSGEPIRADIFEYSDDIYGTAADMAFLTDKFGSSINMVEYNCGNGHLTPLIFDCEANNTIASIQSFLRPSN